MKKQNERIIMEDVEIKKIDVVENCRVRMAESNIDQIMTDIKQRGLLQPIGLLKDKNRYFLRFGQRRLTACKKLGWKTIPAIVKTGSIIDLGNFFADNVAENLERKDISPLELARICKWFLDNGYSIKEIAVKISEPITRIKIALNLARNVPEEFRDELAFKDRPGFEDKISVSVANSITRSWIKNEDRKALFTLAKQHSLNKDDVELIAHLIHADQEMSVAEAYKEFRKYKLTNVRIIVSKVELGKYIKTAGYKRFSDVFVAIVSGKERPNKHLLFNKKGVDEE